MKTTHSLTHVVPTGRTSIIAGSYNPGHTNHVDLALGAIEAGACDKIILSIKPHSDTKANLAAPSIRLEMLRILIEELVPSNQQNKIKVALLPTPYEEQLALVQKLGNPKDTHVREVTGGDTFQSYITGLPTTSPDLTQKHHDVFARKGYEGVTPEFEKQLQELGVSYKLYAAPEEKSLSSTMIREWLKDGKWGNLAVIYPPKALSFLREHAKEFTKLVKR